MPEKGEKFLIVALGSTNPVKREATERAFRRAFGGEELGDLMDELTGQKNTKKGKGAIGFFTRGLVTRSDLYEHGVLMALAKFLAPEWPE